MTTPTPQSPSLVNFAGSAESSFVIAEWEDHGGVSGPTFPIAPLHVHHSDDEAWYVIEGVLQVRAGDEILEAHAGSCLFVPRGKPHTYWNGCPDRLRYLLIMTPRIYALIGAIHAMEARNPAALKAVFERFESEYLG